jgi:putative phosphoesterase
MFVVSDIHMPDRIDKIPDIGEYINSSELIFALGDFTTLAVWEYLKGFRKPIYAVYGNMDEAKLKGLLPSKREIEIDGIKIGLTHGTGTPINIEKRVSAEFEKSLNAYVFGHSHIALNKVINGSLYFNPGALSYIEHSFGFLYIEQKKIWGELMFIK